MARNREFNTEEVLDKAVELFWHKGYNGVSTQEMIDDFGISKSSMYGAFGDKKQWFIAALTRYQKRAIMEVQSSFQEYDNVKDMIQKILESTAENAMSDKNHKGCFIVNSAIELAPHDIQVATILRNHRDMLETILVEAITKGIEKKEFSKDKDPKVLSRLLCCTISGIEADSKFIEQTSYFESCIKTIMKVLD
ncbi:TetR/AcrR family transcriptional regulator [Flavobacterium soyangense]|uniref:TetR/AcrR family transcriptional regulator n=1 Tax=Flavobacterium soyangense TaxID=2023265 RepID=A0A930U9R4_9FLAO|nr:TetR/AcrR family transcriptional regulator [Flavobacterium soyangense]MBF2709543.1 TetR/AcrR family transcriptional regulator [Flavobacterium soyangense]